MDSIREIMNNSIIEMEKSGQIKELMKSQLESMFKSVLQDMFCGYGDIAKKLKEDLKEKLSIDLEEISLPEYNQHLLSIVKKCLDSNISEIGLGKFKSDIDNLMKTDVPKEIKVTELIERFIEYSIKDSYGEAEHGEISFYPDTDSDINSDSYWLHFDFEPNKGKFECSYALLVNKTLRIVEVDGKKYNESIRLGGYFGFDAFLFKMYSIGTKIIDDREDVETGYGDY